MSNLKELKDKDLLLGDNLIMLTGKSVLLEGRHGVILETEMHYPNFEYEETRCGETVTVKAEFHHEYEKKDDLVYKHCIIVSIGFLSRAKTVERKRPEGFISNSSEGLETQLELETQQFVEKYADKLNRKVRLYNIEGGVTVVEDIGCLFDLADTPYVTENKVEIVKRIKISPEIIRDVLRYRKKGDTLFDQIQEEMSELGCPFYTFNRPDGDILLTREDGHKSVELRAYGLTKEKKQ